jgi:hypothetical protein
MAARNQRIRTEIVRGHSFASVAARFQLSDRQVRNIWKQRTEVDRSESGVDAQQAIQDEIDFLDALMSEAVERGEATEHDGVWLGSLRLRLEIRRQQIELRRLYGLLPRGYDQIELQARLVELIASITAVLERHNVPEAVFREIDELRRAEETAAQQTLTPALLPAPQDHGTGSRPS